MTSRLSGPEHMAELLTFATSESQSQLGQLPAPQQH